MCGVERAALRRGMAAERGLESRRSPLGHSPVEAPLPRQALLTEENQERLTHVVQIVRPT